MLVKLINFNCILFYICYYGPLLVLCPGSSLRSPLLLDVAATEGGHAHVITDGMVGREQQMMPLLGFLCKSRREAEFPTEILLRLGSESVDVWAMVFFFGGRQPTSRKV